MISEHAENWLGYPVKVFDAAAAERGVKDYARTIYRLALDWDAEIDFPTLFSKFIEPAASAQTPAIIIGQYHGDDPSQTSDEVIQLLVSAQSRLVNLKGIFLADLVSEENEISWIQQGDVSPLLTAYGGLEHLRIRGSEGLTLGGRPNHEHLKSLTIETGGLPPRLLQEVACGHLPALEHLELWLGTSSYGGDASITDLEPILGGTLFSTLRHLGLRDSEIVDQIAVALKTAPILLRLDSLDLSLGILSDEGGQALLDNPNLKRLKQLDLHHHYLSQEMIKALKRAVPGVNLDDPQDSDTDPDDRYVAVSE
jgi:hypothetical protein